MSVRAERVSLSSLSMINCSLIILSAINQTTLIFALSQGGSPYRYRPFVRSWSKMEEWKIESFLPSVRVGTAWTAMVTECPRRTDQSTHSQKTCSNPRTSHIKASLSFHVNDFSFESTMPGAPRFAHWPKVRRHVGTSLSVEVDVFLPFQRFKYIHDLLFDRS